MELLVGEVVKLVGINPTNLSQCLKESTPTPGYPIPRAIRPFLFSPSPMTLMRYEVVFFLSNDGWEFVVHFGHRDCVGVMGFASF